MLQDVVVIVLDIAECSVRPIVLVSVLIAVGTNVGAVVLQVARIIVRAAVVIRVQKNAQTVVVNIAEEAAAPSVMEIAQIYALVLVVPLVNIVVLNQKMPLVAEDIVQMLALVVV